MVHLYSGKSMRVLTNHYDRRDWPKGLAVGRQLQLTRLSKEPAKTKMHNILPLNSPSESDINSRLTDQVLRQRSDGPSFR